VAVSLDRQDLLADISDKDLTKISETLVNDGDPEPVNRAISWATAEVAKYVAGYVVPGEQEAGYVRGLSIWRLFMRLRDEVPGKWKEEKERIYGELRAIRDGKFKGLELGEAGPAETRAGRGRWGSRSRIKTASEAREDAS
jgi:hypothetical protein